MSDQEILLALRGLARALGLSAAWLKEEADAGRIPSLKAGRRLLFSEAAVRQVLLRRAAGEQPVPNADRGESDR